jgi:hypothetical protein
LLGGDDGQRAANFHTESRDAAHHFQHAREFPALRSLAPGGTHAEAGDAALRGFRGDADDVLRIE